MVFQFITILHVTLNIINFMLHKLNHFLLLNIFYLIILQLNVLILMVNHNFLNVKIHVFLDQKIFQIQNIIITFIFILIYFLFL